MAVKWKNQEELKEYLENLGTEYRFGCLAEKNPEVCHLLGEYLALIKGDHQKAVKIFKTNCDDFDHGRSCYSFGNYLALGKGGEKRNYTKAYNYYQKACEKDITSACYNSGILALNGISNERKEKDYTNGLAYLDKACTLHGINACYLLSKLYLHGTDKNIGKDMKKALEYSEKACELGSIQGCTNLSIMYRKGDGVEKDEVKSKKYKTRADRLKSEVERTALGDS